MDTNTIEYFYQSAIKIVEGSKLLGDPVDIENSKDVIACLYLLYLQRDIEAKKAKTEIHFYGIE